MKNITLAIDDEVLRKVRKLAAARETTVNALVRDFLTRLADQQESTRLARERLRDLSERSTWNPGPDWQWNREELYERGSVSRHERAPLRGFAEPDRPEEEDKGE